MNIYICTAATLGATTIVDMATLTGAQVPMYMYMHIYIYAYIYICIYICTYICMYTYI